ncbi:hypothetical protein [Sphingopyxis panaciterrae]
MPIGGLQIWFDAQRMRDPAPTRWWALTALFGVAATAFGITLTQVFPPSGPAIADGYGSPVIAFEFARSQADLLGIFGADSDPLQVSRLAAMRTGNEQDYLYMLLYAGFLASGCIALWRELRSRHLLAAAALPVLAALSDAWENWLLLDIQAAFTIGEYSPAMASLPWPVAAKFLLLALTNVAIGHAMTQMGRWWQLAGTLVIVASLPVVMALVAPADFGWTLIASIGGGWIVLLGMAAIGSWRALIGKRPLVDFERRANVRRTADRGEAEPPETVFRAAPRRRFGRRKSDR